MLATKVHGRMRPGPNGAGLSRKAILAEIDASLTRLGTDYVDLYQIHRFDYPTPIEETLDALDEVVRSGKARYIGASSMYAWQFAKMLATQEKYGLARFVSMQDYVNLLYREEEREMLPLCAAEGIGVIPWSPLARGRLTRDWDTRRRAPRPTSSARRSMPTPRMPTARSSRRSPMSPRSAACRGRRSRSPGCCRRSSSPRRSSARPRWSISTTPPPRCRSGSIDDRDRPAGERPTCPTPSPASPERDGAAPPSGGAKFSKIYVAGHISLD